MKASVKSSVESALVAAAAAAVCLWQLIVYGSAEDGDTARIVMYALGLSIALIAHWTFLALALQRSGRAVVPWTFGLVVLCPITSVVALVLLAADEEQPA
ncbi:hypothetical protein RQP53_13150 [Paucibacter sp. APW11]|uniref:Uncharacterized protein n=1 Tax=Roseateles aquae TaxID=3077235 RepID=A0ABU3PCB4_9BURK|nr:hypothetical protein [Paucibacter sp. APW11]MDT9000216.1 hypothetical protein [Paucibacter sp. APW11]